MRLVYHSILLLYLSFVNAYAFDTGRVIKKYYSVDGLSNNIIHNIEQDSDGFIWFATHDGACRFNGLDFKTFEYKDNDSTSLSGNIVTRIFKDSNKNLWVCTSNGLNLYNPELENFKRLINDGTPNSISGKKISDICESFNKNLWITTSDGGINYYNSKTAKFRNYNSESEIYVRYAYKVFEDSKKRVWLSSSRKTMEVYYTDSNGNLTICNDVNISLINSIRPSINVIFEDNFNNIWIASSEGVFIFNNKWNELINITKSDKVHGLNNNYIQTIKQDSHGNILIGTQQGGLNIISSEQIESVDPEDYRFTHIKPGILKENISYRTISAILKDRDNNIWMGTHGGGVNLIPSIRNKFRLITHNPADKKSLTHNKVWGICEDKNGELWIGTDGGGINRINLNSDEIKIYKNDKSEGCISDNAILSACCDNNGELWFGTYEGGLNKYNRDSDNFISFGRNGNSKQKLYSDDIRALDSDDNNNLWIAANGYGLVKRDPSTGKFHKIIPENSSFGLSNIRAIEVDRSSEFIWLGTYGNGLLRYNTSTNRIKHYHANKGKNSITCSRIVTLNLDKKGQLWIGGWETGGLNILNTKNDSITVYSSKNGLINNSIHSIVFDKRDNVWISTNRGISMFNAKNKTFTNYEPFNGVQDREFADNSGFISNSGYICFGGAGGLNIFNPASVVKSKFQPKIFFTDFKIFNKSVKPNDTSSPLSEVIDKTSYITLNHTQNVFTISFAGINYAYPGMNRFAYKLENTDNKWNYLGKEKSVTFRNLKAGKYKFSLKVANHDGHFSANHRTLNLIVKPPYWKSNIAYIIYSLLFALIVFRIYIYTRKQIRLKNNLILEQELRKKDSELHQSKLRFFTNISHEFRTPLTLILNTIEEFKSILSNNDPKLSAIERNSLKLLSLIDRLLEFRKSETNNLKLNISESDIIIFLQEIFDSFSELAKNKQINYCFNSNYNSVSVNIDKPKFEMIVNNLLSNAFKFTPNGGNISLSVDIKGINNAENIIIEVEDSGVGIEKDNINKIFQRYYQENESDYNSSTGIGLALVKSLTELHKGKIKVSSIKGKGSKFSVSIPIHTSNRDNKTSSGKINENNNPNIQISNTRKDTESVLEKIKLLSKEKLKIVIVEDNQELSEFLYKNLSKHFNVSRAFDGVEGLNTIKEHLPGLVISDIMMPKMNGIDMCRVLKSDISTSHIPVILLTANVADTTHIKGMEAGADIYLPKPFNLSVLTSAILNLITSRKKLRTYYNKLFTGEIENNESQLSKDEEFLQKIYKLIYNNISDSSLSVKFLYENCNMSKSLFYNKIKSLTGKSPIDIIREARINKAAEFIKSGNYKIFEAAEQSGFNDIKSFRKLFREVFGCTPSEYQKKRASE